MEETGVSTYNLVQTTFNRDGIRAGEDDAAITFHIRQVVEAAPDFLPVTDEGRDDFVNRLSTWWGAINGYVSGQAFMAESRFYDIPDGGPFPNKDPRAWMGDPVKTHVWNSPGTSGNPPLPPQVAASVTLKTAHRKRWGRYYLPCLTTAVLDGKGALLVGAADAMAAATHNLTSRSGTGACLTVFSRLHWNHEDPQTIQVDDILDVIRRRRYSMPLFRQTLSAG